MTERKSRGRRLAAITMSTGPAVIDNWRELNWFAHHVCDEFLIKLHDATGVTRTRSIERISIGIERRLANPFLYQHIYVCSLAPEAVLDRAGKPSRLKIARAIADVSKVVLPDEGISVDRINKAFEKMDLAVAYFQEEWKLKIINDKPKYPRIAAKTRVDHQKAQIFASVVGGAEFADCYLLTETSVLFEDWQSKLGNFTWINDSEFVLNDRSGNEVGRVKLQ